MVWVNGHSAGCFKDTRLPSEFDITDYLDFSADSADAAGQAGMNTIALMVVRYSDASFVEDQDQWWFGGIHRSVYLYSTENMWIEDVETVPDLRDSIADSAVVAEIPLKIRMGIKEDVPGN